MLTIYDGDEDIYRGLQAGAKGYLLKDAKPNELLNTIRKFAKTAAERDHNGDSRPIHEIEQLRQSSLLNLVIPKIYED